MQMKLHLETEFKFLGVFRERMKIVESGFLILILFKFYFNKYLQMVSKFQRLPFFAIKVVDSKKMFDKFRVCNSQNAHATLNFVKDDLLI